jgi:glycosyltransferase involved in cell wall biosynthesis
MSSTQLKYPHLIRSVPVHTSVRVALLTNFLPPYRIPAFELLAGRAEAFRIFLSTAMEANRYWTPDFGGLDVRIQKSITRKRLWRHPNGFTETLYTHYPYDTLYQLGAYRPSVVLSGEFGFRTLAAVIYRIFRRSSRLIIWATLSEYSEQGRGWARRALRWAFLRFADAVLVNGQSGARYISSLGYPQRRVFLLPQTVEVRDLARVPLFRFGEAAHRILIVGNLVERKNIGGFLRVLGCWCEDHPERNVDVSIAGDGPERKNIESEPRARNLAVRLFGNVSYSDLPRVYEQAGALAFPTLADEWGLVVNEAMAAGLPVLGSLYSQAVEDLVSDGENGWVFHPDQSEEVYMKLDRFFATPDDDLNRMRSRARETAVQLTPESMANGIVNAIQFVQSQ